jgi:hypothetical protein
VWLCPITSYHAICKEYANTDLDISKVEYTIGVIQVNVVHVDPSTTYAKKIYNLHIAATTHHAF